MEHQQKWRRKLLKGQESQKTQLKIYASKVIRTDIFMEEVQKYVCFTTNTVDFTDRNMKVNCWEKVASKFDLTPQQAETKFRNGRTTYTQKVFTKEEDSTFWFLTGGLKSAH